MKQVESTDNFRWLIEPEKSDNTYRKRGEETLHWLKRSTVPLAVASREFLNRNLQNIPNEFREELINRFSNDWNNTLFELIVARYLQELGADLVYQEIVTGGKRPDFTARFPDGTITVEATNPVINPEVEETEKNQKLLLDYIESKKHTGWLVCVSKLPKIGPNDSKKEFKRTIDEIFIELKLITERKEVEISRNISQGEIILDFYKTSKIYHRIAIEPVITVFDNTESRIAHVFDKKRNQVRNSQYPKFLAINANGIANEFEDFDKALFGYNSELYDEDIRKKRKLEFIEAGLFTKANNSNRTFAGVIAFIQSGLHSRKAPVLYLNPKVQEKLPESLLQLERRFYDSNNRVILTADSKQPELIRKLFFPNPSPNT